MCPALQSQLRIITWAGLPLMNDLECANTKYCLLLWPLGAMLLVLL